MRRSGNSGHQLSAFAWQLLVLLLGVPGVSLPARAGVSVALVASPATVQPGAAIEVRIEVTQSGDAFNGYEAQVDFDPTALTFVPSSPLSLQEGDLMTSACASRLHLFESEQLPLSIAHGLMCANMPVSGPGELYVLHFLASNQTQPTEILFAGIKFFCYGSTVQVSSATSTTVWIGAPTDAPPRVRDVAAIRLTASPNPFNPSTVIEVLSQWAGDQDLIVYDVRGRLVRSLEQGHFDAGTRRVLWDGRDDQGVRLSSGTYIIQVRSKSAATSRRVVLLK